MIGNVEMVGVYFTICKIYTVVILTNLSFNDHMNLCKTNQVSKNVNYKFLKEISILLSGLSFLVVSAIHVSDSSGSVALENILPDSVAFDILFMFLCLINPKFC